MTLTEKTLVAIIAGQAILMVVMIVRASLQERFLLGQIQILVNKAMSPSFPSYQRAIQDKVTVPLEPAEDLNRLAQFP